MPSFSSRGKCKSSYGGVQRRAIFTEVNVKTCGNSFGGKCLIHHKLKHHCFSAGRNYFGSIFNVSGSLVTVIKSSLWILCTRVFWAWEIWNRFFACGFATHLRRKTRCKRASDIPMTCQSHVKTYMPQSFFHVFYQANIWKESTQSPERHFLTPQFGGNWNAKK